MRFVSLLALSAPLLVSAALAACTETPSYFPPCVDPSMPCTDAGADASEGGPADATVADAPGEATVTDAPGEATAPDAP